LSKFTQLSAFNFIFIFYFDIKQLSLSDFLLQTTKQMPVSNKDYTTIMIELLLLYIFVIISI